jgi:hypothetical protein
MYGVGPERAATYITSHTPAERGFVTKCRYSPRNVTHPLAAKGVCDVMGARAEFRNGPPGAAGGV